MDVAEEEGQCDRRGRCQQSSRVVTREVDMSGSTTHGLRCVPKATRKVGASQVKVSVAEEVGGGRGRRQSSCGQSGYSDRRGSRNYLGEVFVGSSSGPFGDLGGWRLHQRLRDGLPPPEV